MRKINWRKFRPNNVLHFKDMVSTELFWYDHKGKIIPFTIDSIYKDTGLPTAIWAKAQPIGHYASLEFAINESSYCFGWPKYGRIYNTNWAYGPPGWDYKDDDLVGGRLSSLPEHEYYWRNNIWLTMEDRDFIFDYFTRGMFGESKWVWSK